MKIYHTETQADYDALMVELENDGVTWRSGVLPTKENNWKLRPKNMCVAVSHQVAEYGSVDTYLKIYSDIPIAKYKAKADEKMRFTKENVEKVIDDYFCQADFEPCGDLIAEINNLDDTRKKAVVPKCFDEWYQEIKGDWQKDSNAKTFALWKLCQQGFGHGFERANGKVIHSRSELGTWLDENTFLAIDAVLNDYTVEPEQLYYIPLPHLETSDGLQQVLSQREGDKNYFASRPSENLKQRYTKEELKCVPVSYKPYAKPIEEREE